LRIGGGAPRDRGDHGEAGDMSHGSTEVGAALCIALGFAAIGYMTMQLPGNGLRLSRTPQTYLLAARFDNVGDLKIYSPIKIGGVRIGRVESIGYDSTDYKAVVTLGIERRYEQIPQDSDAVILSTGLLGGSYVGITPGGSNAFLRPGTQIAFTRSAFSLEGAVNKLLVTFSGR
jgi:phospholipid/cholesterol/gamma-HCH transport system substrate-binding protein